MCQSDSPAALVLSSASSLVDVLQKYLPAALPFQREFSGGWNVGLKKARLLTGREEIRNARKALVLLWGLVSYWQEMAPWDMYSLMWHKAPSKLDFQVLFSLGGYKDY